MSKITPAQLARADKLVKDAGRNIIEAIGIMKELRQSSIVADSTIDRFKDQVENAKHNLEEVEKSATHHAVLPQQPSQAAHYTVTKDKMVENPEANTPAYTIGVDLARPGGDKTVHMSKYARKLAERRRQQREQSINEEPELHEYTPHRRRASYNVPIPETGLAKPGPRRTKKSWSKNHGRKKGKR